MGDFSANSTTVGRSFMSHSRVSKVRTCVTLPLDSENEIHENFECFLGNRWQIHRVTPLWGFQYGDGHLSRYSRLVGKSLGSAGEEGISNKTTFKILEGIKSNNTDNEAVTIQVHQALEGVERLLFEGILLSSGRSTEIVQNNPMVYLPVMLIRGQARISNLVKEAISKIFDCTIFPVHYPPLELEWQSAAWSRQVQNRDKTFNLKFAPPGYVGGNLSKIDICIPVEHVKSIWKCCPTKSDSELLLEEVRVFHSILREHFHAINHWNLDTCTLMEFRAGGVVFSSEGKVKINSAAAAAKVVVMITEYCESLADIEGMTKMLYA